MSLLSITGLETHETGTENLNAIINGNWAIIEALFGGGLGMTTITYAASVDVSVSTSKPVNKIALTGNVAITVTDMGAGRFRWLILSADGTDRTVTWPVGSVWASAQMLTIPAGTTVVVLILSQTALASGLVLCSFTSSGVTVFAAPFLGRAVDTRGNPGDLCLDGTTLWTKLTNVPYWVSQEVATED